MYFDRWIRFITGLVFTLTLSSRALSAGFQGLSGDYCATRPDGCCNGRKDVCDVKVFSTRCYCDDFCDREKDDDCCPDYWSVCKGIETTTPSKILSCYLDGKYYSYGAEVKINCNACKCESNAIFNCEKNVCLVDENLIEKIETNRSMNWRPVKYLEFWGRTLSDGLLRRTGTLEPLNTVRKMKPVMGNYQKPLPRHFDARAKWPGLIAEPMDQGWCGASWAISTVGVASDRFGIMSNGLEKVKLSAQHLLSCNNRGQQGCQGGHLSRAWQYIRKFGLVDEECYNRKGTSDKCRLPKKITLQSAGCESPNTPRTEPYKTGPAYRLKSEQDIMAEILESGPVQATMKVYRDFFSYKNGIYTKYLNDSAKDFGYHSVRIIGWGDELNEQGRSIKYWIAVNSWGQFWGENGYFRIVRGANECEIEDFVIAAWSMITKKFATNYKEAFNLV